MPAVASSVKSIGNRLSRQSSWLRSNPLSPYECRVKNDSHMCWTLKCNDIKTIYHFDDLQPNLSEWIEIHVDFRKSSMTNSLVPIKLQVVRFALDYQYFPLRIDGFELGNHFWLNPFNWTFMLVVNEHDLARLCGCQPATDQYTMVSKSSKYKSNKWWINEKGISKSLTTYLNICWPHNTIDWKPVGCFWLNLTANSNRSRCELSVRVVKLVAILPRKTTMGLRRRPFQDCEWDHMEVYLFLYKPSSASGCWISIVLLSLPQLLFRIPRFLHVNLSLAGDWEILESDA